MCAQFHAMYAEDRGYVLTRHDRTKTVVINCQKLVEVPRSYFREGRSFRMGFIIYFIFCSFVSITLELYKYNLYIHMAILSSMTLKYVFPEI